MMTSGVKLVAAEYASSDDEDEADSSRDKNSEDKNVEVNRLPLPSQFLITGDNDQEEINDDPDEHEGRSRRYPHKRGNWNSLVYIPYVKNEPFNLLCEQIIDLCRPQVDLKQISDPHISLTRTFVLLYHWIDNFVSSVKGSLRTFSRFDLQFDGLKTYCNEDSSRTFLALTVGFGKMEITKTVQLLDKCLAEYKLHPFYDEGSFHMSIVWALGDKKSEMDALLPQLNSLVEANLSDSLDLTIPITNYICKIGHKIYNVDLL